MVGSAPSGPVRTVIGLLLGALILTACTDGSAPRSASTASSAAATWAAADPRLPGIFTIGLPEFAEFAGALEVFHPDGTRQRLTAAGLGLPPADQSADPPSFLNNPGHYFGASSVVADLNGDGAEDLVVGAPGGRLGDEDPGEDTEEEANRDALTPARADPPPGQSGRVWILLNGPGGFTADRVIPVPVPARVGDQVGAALAVTRRAAGNGRDLWVGAPGLTVRGRGNAGTVYRFTLSALAVPTLRDTITLDDPLVPGSAESFDGFGAVLAPATNGVVVGVPAKTLNRVSFAGEVVRLRTSRADGRLLPADVYSQASPGVAGEPRPYGGFGAVVAADGLAVGVPRSRVEKHNGAGSVQLFTPSTRRPDSLVPGRSLHQGSPGVPGVTHPYVSFGSSLTIGDFSCPGVPALAIATRDNYDAPAFLSSVTVVPLAGAGTDCPAVVLRAADLTPSAGVLSVLNTPSVSRLSTKLAVVHADSTSASGVDRLLIGFAQVNRVFVWGGPTGRSTDLGTYLREADTLRLSFGGTAGR